MAFTFLIFGYTCTTIAFLYFFLRTSLNVKWSVKKQTKWWILFGFLFNFFSFSWIYAIYPVSWLKEGIIQYVGIFGIHLLVATASGLCFSIVGLSFHKKITQDYRPAFFSFSLVVAEILRSLTISLISYKDGVTINLHFVIGTLGSALASIPLIEYAYFGGTFALTFILGYSTYILVSKKHILFYWKHGAGICIIFLSIHFFMPVYTPAKPIKVGIITTNFLTSSTSSTSPDLVLQNTQLHSLTTSLSTAKPDIIVYPEDTRYTKSLQEKDVSLLAMLFPSTLFIDGDSRVFDKKTVNISLFYNPTNGKAQARGKTFLLPFGEYTPWLFTSIFKFFIGQEKMNAYLKNHDYTPIVSNKTIVFNQMRIGTLLCSELLSHKTIHDLRNENPSLVFFQSKMSLFHNNLWVNVHMYLLTKVTAAELRRTLISSVNNAPSYIVSPYGKVILTIPTGFSTSTYSFFDR